MTGWLALVRAACRGGVNPAISRVGEELSELRSGQDAQSATIQELAALLRASLRASTPVGGYADTESRSSMTADEHQVGAASFGSPPPLPSGR